MKKADIGVVGLAVMGENLALNMESKGFTVAVYNRTAEKTEKFASGRGTGKNIIPAFSLKEFADNLEKPRKVMMMVKAGKPVDDTIDQLLAVLEPGDIIIDGGNSLYKDTNRRTEKVEEAGLLYVGCGVSGGEEGALNGPSMMPGGSEKAWEYVGSVFKAICAKAEGDECCTWIGQKGAGHFVKMVHNGIEYGDMELICEAFNIMKNLLGLSYDEMGEIFTGWNEGELKSYLIEITGRILKEKDEDGRALVEMILDVAGQKGTGKWTGIEALDEGVPLTLIAEAVFARCLSAFKEERVSASAIYGKEVKTFNGDKAAVIEDIKKALYASKIVSYAQGFALMSESMKEYGWQLDLGSIAMIWRGGCIIRSAFLGKIKEAFDENKELKNLLAAPAFVKEIKEALPSWRRIVCLAAEHGVPVPSMMAALSYFDGYTSAVVPANLIQAQRDFFGAHTYERTDSPRGEFFHTDWSGIGSDAASGTYTV